MEYNNLEELREAHISNKTTVDQELSVGGITYELVPYSKGLHEMLQEDKNCAVVYTAREDQQLSEDTPSWIALAFTKNLSPLDIVSGRVQSDVISEETRIGDKVTVEVANIPSAATVKALVDTGATYSTLHADKWEVKGSQVHFVSKPLSQNVIRMPLETQQAVKSPGDDVEYRPVISLDIKINGELLKDQLFNLSDRGQMEHPMLLGQNTLEDGNFLIDPRMNEQLDWPKIDEKVQELKSSITEQEMPDADEDKVRQVYNVLREADVTFEDIIRIIRADAMKVMEEITY